MQAPANIDDAVERFMQIANQTVKGRNNRQMSLYIGLMIEELRETLSAVEGGVVSSHPLHGPLRDAIVMLSTIETGFKQNQFEAAVAAAPGTELADGFVDSAWVALGALFSLARNPFSCIWDVADSNFSKFTDGKAMFDANGKIMKPPTFREPDLSKFVD